LSRRRASHDAFVPKFNRDTSSTCIVHLVDRSESFKSHHTFQMVHNTHISCTQDAKTKSQNAKLLSMPCGARQSLPQMGGPARNSGVDLWCFYSRQRMQSTLLLGAYLRSTKEATLLHCKYHSNLFRTYSKYMSGSSHEHVNVLPTFDQRSALAHFDVRQREATTAIVHHFFHLARLHDTSHHRARSSLPPELPVHAGLKNESTRSVFWVVKRRDLFDDWFWRHRSTCRLSMSLEVARFRA
jgi:hypothetical protein